MDATDDDRKADWYFADGEEYRGEPFEDDKGKPFGERYVMCSRCGGSGKWRRGRRFGACGTCGGDKETFEQARIYTPAQMESKERKRAATRASRDEVAARKESERVARWDAFLVDNADLMAEARASTDKFVQSVIARAENYGGLTEAQTRAVRDKLDRIVAERTRFSGSTPVATPGERIDVEVECTGRGSFLAKGFGRHRGSREVFVTEMIDGDGNAFVSVSEAFKLNEGDRATLRGTVKEHDTVRKAWCRTVLSRVSVLSLTPAAVPEGTSEEELELAAAP